MSAALPDHERPDSSVVRKSIPQSDSQMEGATQSKSDRGSIAGGAKGNTMAAAQASGTDDGTSVRSRQDTRTEGKPVNKQSLDYMLRSGCAGGLAGCTVSVIPFYFIFFYPLAFGELVVRIMSGMD